MPVYRVQGLLSRKKSRWGGRDRAPSIRICARRCLHQRCRVPFQPHEASRLRHSPFDQRSASASLFDRMGFQVEYPQDERRGTCDADRQVYRGRAFHVPADSLRPKRSNRRRGVSGCGKRDSTPKSSRPTIPNRGLGRGPVSIADTDTPDLHPAAHARPNVVRGRHWRLPERSISGSDMGPPEAMLARRWWADAPVNSGLSVRRDVRRNP